MEWRHCKEIRRSAIDARRYTRLMYGKVKQLRGAGKRLSDHDIARSDFAAGEVRVFGLGSSIVTSVTDPQSQVGDPLIPVLYEAKLITMHGTKMLLKGEERPQGVSGPAYVQEWAVVVGKSV